MHICIIECIREILVRRHHANRQAQLKTQPSVRAEKLCSLFHGLFRNNGAIGEATVE